MTKREIKNEPKDKRTTKKDRHLNKSKEENDYLVFIRRTSCRTRQRRKTDTNKTETREKTMTLIPRNLEQMRRLAVEEYKKKHEPKYINRTQQSNFMSPMKIDITSMRNFIAEQKINNYLSIEVAEEELTSTLTHYQMIKMKERVKDFISKVTQKTPDSFTLRTTAEFISDFINQYNIKKDIKENKR